MKMEKFWAGRGGGARPSPLRRQEAYRQQRSECSLILYPPVLSGGYAPPRGQANKLKTLPSRHTTQAGDKKRFSPEPYRRPTRDGQNLHFQTQFSLVSSVQSWLNKLRIL